MEDMFPQGGATGAGAFHGVMTASSLQDFPSSMVNVLPWILSQQTLQQISSMYLLNPSPYQVNQSRVSTFSFYSSQQSPGSGISSNK